MQLTGHLIWVQMLHSSTNPYLWLQNFPENPVCYLVHFLILQNTAEMMCWYVVIVAEEKILYLRRNIYRLSPSNFCSLARDVPTSNDELPWTYFKCEPLPFFYFHYIFN